MDVCLHAKAIENVFFFALLLGEIIFFDECSVTFKYFPTTQNKYRRQGREFENALWQQTTEFKRKTKVGIQCILKC